MKTKKWMHFDDECPECGDNVEVFTDSNEENVAFEDDEAKCVSCHMTGSIMIHEEYGAAVVWNYDFETE